MSNTTQEQEKTEIVPDGAAMPGDGTGSAVNHDGNTGAANASNPDHKPPVDQNAAGGELTPHEATGGD